MNSAIIFSSLLSFGLFGFSAQALEKTLVDFTTIERAGSWAPLTDSIRGGKSTILMEVQTDETAKISGNLTLIDGAGFASYRVNPIEVKAWDIQGNSEIKVESKGDGRTYRILVKDSTTMESERSYSWQASFTPTADLSTQQVLLQDFEAVVRGQVVTDVPALNLSDIREIGIQINDGQAGPFEMQLKSIKSK